MNAWDAELAPESERLECSTRMPGEDIGQLRRTFGCCIRWRIWIVHQTADQLKRDRTRKYPSYGAADIAVEIDSNRD